MVSLGGKKNSEEARILYYPQNEILLLFFVNLSEKSLHICKKCLSLYKLIIYKSPVQDGKLGKNVMCTLSKINWAVVKSNKKISNSLSQKLNKIRFGGTEENTFSFYFRNQEDLKKIIDLLNSFKKQQFEIVQFTDKQFGLTLNYFSSFQNATIYDQKVEELPLSNRFRWFDNSDKKRVTPITKKQFENIIKINY